MKGLTLNLGEASTEKIVGCIKDIAENVSARDIVEIVLKPSMPEPARIAKSKSETVMTSKEIAEILGKSHSIIFNKIAKFLCSEADSSQVKEFRLSSFKIPQGAEYPMYELSEKACNFYYEWVGKHNNYKTVADSMERLKKAISKRFHQDNQRVKSTPESSQFLLKGEARADYGKICEMFDDFITGPGMEGREIKELTESYEQFYNAMQIVGLDIQDRKRLESALAGVAIESEMQGFVYGFRLFAEMMIRRVPEMQEVVV